MIYSTTEYLGLALLFLAFLGAGIAIARLDHALIGEPEAATETDSDAAPASDESAEPPARESTTSPYPGKTRRARRKHGR